MEPPEDPYFERMRIWRLSLFDHEGESTEYWFEISGNRMKPIPAQTEDLLGWTTEVPAKKVFAALELGESLTSMYLRINDTVFSKDVEMEIATVDVVEDPLIRCLFNGRFGAYQQAQLARLKSEGRLKS
jgi:hypothetical protein